MSVYIPDWSEVLAVSHSRGADSEAPHLWDGLVGCWSMLQGGGKTLYDISGYGNHGTLTNFADIGAAWVPGNPRSGGYALDFDGANDTIALSSFNVGTDAITASIWGNWSAVPDDILFGNSVVSRYTLYVAATDVLFRTASGFVSVTHNGVTQGIWYHFAVTRTVGGAVVFYQDGALIGTATRTGALDDIDSIGSRGDGVFEMNGMLSDLSVHNRALSPSEIQLLYERPNAMLNLRRRVFPATVAAGGAGTTNPFSMGAVNLFQGKLAG